MSHSKDEQIRVVKVIADGQIHLYEYDDFIEDGAADVTYLLEKHDVNEVKLTEAEMSREEFEAIKDAGLSIRQLTSNEFVGDLKGIKLPF